MILQWWKEVKMSYYFSIGTSIEYSVSYRKEFFLVGKWGVSHYSRLAIAESA